MSNIFKPIKLNYITRPYGLLNNSTLCYLNSIIQSFTSSSIFNEYLLTNKNKFILNNNKLALLFIEIIEYNINLQNENKIHTENIEILRELIKLKQKSNNNFYYNGQQDVSECISFLIESVYKNSA